MNKPAINLTDLIEIQKAFLLLYSIVDEVQLTTPQFQRKMDCIMGRVVLNRVMSSLNVELEVTT